jgi:hypothetical protein
LPVKAASELLELFEREFEILTHALEQRLCRLGVLAQALLGHSQMKRECDETLLGAIVQVPLKPPALRDTRLDDPCTRGRQLVVGLRALERERDQLREVGETLFCIGWEKVGPRREDEERTPKTLVSGDRCDDRRQVAG